MEINWQNIFYITSSLAMIVFLIASIWFMWLLFIASKLIKNFVARAQKLNNSVDEIRYLITGVKLKVSRFLLKILDRKSQNKQK